MTLTRDSYIHVPVPIEKELKELFEQNASLIIFDVGSCEGEDSIKYARLLPNAKIYAVEALPSNLPLLQATLDKYSTGNIEVIPIALSNQKSTATFHVSSGHPDDLPVTDWDYGNKSSSLLPPDQSLTDHHPWLKFNQTITVETNTLQQVCAERNIAQIDFMHIDVQGAELRVLQGAGELLRRVKVIWMEVEAVPLYEAQPLKAEVECFMHSYGFTKLKDTVGGVAGDQLYINSSYLFKVRIQSILSRSMKAFKEVLKPLIPLSIRQQLRQHFSAATTVEQTTIEQTTSSISIDHFEQKTEEQRTSYKISYSQSGEDLIIKFIFDALNVEKPSYLDIGAHDPFFLSNTALLYSRGSRGINIEPDPRLFQAFLNVRPDDTNLNIGIASAPGDVDFYQMSASTLNTLSKDEAERYHQEAGYTIESVTKVRVDTISNVLEQHYSNQFPDLLTLDAEGLDSEIIQSINYESCLPTIICVETITFSETGNGIKDQELIEFLTCKGYFVYADTFINTIFVQSSKWNRQV